MNKKACTAIKLWKFLARNNAQILNFSLCRPLILFKLAYQCWVDLPRKKNFNTFLIKKRLFYVEIPFHFRNPPHANIAIGLSFNGRVSDKHRWIAAERTRDKSALEATLPE